MDKATDAETMSLIRHDIRNQLSNINLLLGELRHEIANATPDCLTYIDMITSSTAKIDAILKEPE